MTQMIGQPRDLRLGAHGVECSTRCGPVEEPEHAQDVELGTLTQRVLIRCHQAAEGFISLGVFDFSDRRPVGNSLVSVLRKLSFLR